jgi:hypothetical protein
MTNETNSAIQIAERDNIHEWADKLAQAIADHFEFDIGEHSNVNNPWAVAFDGITNQPDRAPAAPEPAPTGLFLVAEVCSNYELRWVGSEPIATLLARCPGVKVGSFLYAWPASAAAPEPVLASAYHPSVDAVKEALVRVDRIRDSYPHWKGWSGIPQACEMITHLLRYGSAAAPVPASGEPVMGNRNV